MTEVVKKAEAIRESRNGPSQPNGLPKSETQAAKDRAKVVKKPAARVVKPCEELGKGDAGSSEKPVASIFLITFKISIVSSIPHLLNCLC